MRVELKCAYNSNASCACDLQPYKSHAVVWFLSFTNLQLHNPNTTYQQTKYINMSLKFDEARAMFERYFCYTFLDPTWLEEALYMGGPTKIGGRAVPNGNKRLAQLGDSVLQLATVNECFDGGLSKGKSFAGVLYYHSSRVL